MAAKMEYTFEAFEFQSNYFRKYLPACRTCNDL